MAKRVMLVDDTETVLMAEKMMLAAQKLDIVLARNGLEALEKIADSPPGSGAE